MLRSLLQNLRWVCMCVGVVMSACFVWDIPQVQAASLLCHVCKSNQDCGANAVCVGGQTGAGYCAEPCGTGESCPTGFKCNWLAPGLQQCMPDKQGCFVSCDANKPCVTGFQCADSRCMRTGGGVQGDFCDAKASCATEYLCLTNQNGASRCAKRCGPAWGEAGSPCQEGKCNTGLSCISNGTNQVCVQECQGTCAAQQQCTTVGQKSYCVCREDKDCSSGEFCNKGVFGFQGACTKDPFASNPNPCASGLSCQPFMGQGYLCLPKDGIQGHGMMCSAFLPCRSGFQCFQYTQQAPAMCYQDCLKADNCQAQGLGTCNFIGRTGNYCFCSKDQDCGRGQSCYPVPDSPFQHGLCRPGPQSTCSQTDECPSDYACTQGTCKPTSSPQEPNVSENTVTPENTTSDASEANPQESVVSPEPSSEQSTQEPVVDQQPGPEASGSEQPTSPPDTPDTSVTDQSQTTDTKISTPSACACAGSSAENFLWLFLWVGLYTLLLVSRRTKAERHAL